METKERVLQFITVVIIAAIIVGGVFFLLPSYHRTEELKRQSQQLAEQIEQQKREIAKLQEYQQRFRSDPDFVERIARQNNKVFPGELVFVFEKN